MAMAIQSWQLQKWKSGFRDSNITSNTVEAQVQIDALPKQSEIDNESASSHSNWELARNLLATREMRLWFGGKILERVKVR